MELRCLVFVRVGHQKVAERLERMLFISVIFLGITTGLNVPYQGGAICFPLEHET